MLWLRWPKLRAVLPSGCDCARGRALWLVPGLASLAVFAGLLTLAPSEVAGRAFAACGGIYIAASLGWIGVVKGHAPDALDLAGAAICLAGAAVILFAPGGIAV